MRPSGTELFNTFCQKVFFYEKSNLDKKSKFCLTIRERVFGVSHQSRLSSSLALLEITPSFLQCLSQTHTMKSLPVFSFYHKYYLRFGIFVVH